MRWSLQERTEGMVHWNLDMGLLNALELPTIVQSLPPHIKIKHILRSISLVSDFFLAPDLNMILHCATRGMGLD